MKQKTNESISKNSANLDEIMHNTDEMDALLNSREFITTLINDLLNNKRNIVEWKIVDGNGSANDIDGDSIKDTFGVDYSFEFKYKYQDVVVPLTLFITGNIPFNVSPRRSGDWFTPPEGGEVSIDFNKMGSDLDLSLFDKDGSELNVKWLTPDLSSKVAKQILQDYL